MKKISLFLLVLITLISKDVFCQEDSVVVTKYNEHYVEIQSLRFVLDSLGPCPTKLGDGCVVRYDFRPKRQTLKNGIVLVKDRNNLPLELSFYDDSVLIQNNYFKSNGNIDYQDFGNSRIGGSINNDCYVVLFWNKEHTIDRIHYFFDKKKMIIQYNSNERKPSITIEPQ